MGQFLPHTPTNQLGHDPLKHRVLFFFSLSDVFVLYIFIWFCSSGWNFPPVCPWPCTTDTAALCFAVSGSHNLCHKARRTWRTWRTQLGWGLQWHRWHWPHDISHRNIANSGNNREVTIRMGALSWEWWEEGGSLTDGGSSLLPWEGGVSNWWLLLLKALHDPQMDCVLTPQCKSAPECNSTTTVCCSLIQFWPNI